MELEIKSSVGKMLKAKEIIVLPSNKKGIRKKKKDLYNKTWKVKKIVYCLFFQRLSLCHF